jgi:hypothetical protein
MFMQGKMCRSHARHDPEGPRTKTNPPSRGEAHPSQHEARNDLQTVDRHFFQTSGKILRVEKNVLLQDLSRQTPDRRDQSAECMQILMPIDNATRCPTKAGRLVIVKIPGTRNWGTGSIARTVVVVASIHRC